MVDKRTIKVEKVDKDIRVYLNIVEKLMNIPPIAFHSELFNSLIVAYLTKDMSFLDMMTNTISEGYKIQKEKNIVEKKMNKSRIFDHLAIYATKPEDLSSRIRSDIYSNLTDNQAQELSACLLPLWWHLSESFLKHRKINVRGLYQKYFVEGKRIKPRTKRKLLKRI